MIEEPRCSVRRCKHLIGVGPEEEDEDVELCVCTAFPDGIPDEIAYGNDLHLTRHPKQQNDIVYEERTLDDETEHARAERERREDI